MRKLILGLFLFSLSSSSFAGGATVPAGEAGDPIKILFEAKCASCHAKDGKGKATMAKMLKLDKPESLDLSQTASLDKKKEEWVAIIAKGLKKMPAFEKKLKATEIDGLVDYIRSLVSPK